MRPQESLQNVRIDKESRRQYEKRTVKSRILDPFATSFQKLLRGKTIHSTKPPTKPVIPQDRNADATLDGEMEHSDQVFHPQPSNSRAVEQDFVTTLQYAHHFSIGGNARIVNQNGNRGIYGLDVLERFVSFGALHDSSTQDPERCCHPGTRQDVLDQMHTWMDDPHAPERILWLHGPAGVGKSAITQTISYSYGRDKVGATFFFFRSDPTRNDGNRLFPTIAWQLALSISAVKDLITSSLEDYPDLPRKAIEIQFDQLIVQPFLTISADVSASLTSIRLIIIDGLDECSDTKLQQRILKLIGNAIANPRFPLRFVISCRSEAHIQDFFAQFQYPTLRIDLANVDGAYRDIETYLKSQFARIAFEQELDCETWPGQCIIDTLVSQSSGQFIYASTTIKYVGDEYESAVAQLNIILGLKLFKGKLPFADLDILYVDILQRQPDPDFLKEFLPILVARSMLDDMKDEDFDGDLDDAMLLGLSEKELRRKLRGMHSLLNFEPFITAHHKSFLDFLLDPSRSGEHHVSKHFANRRYMELITGILVKAASNAIEHIHEGDHFNPRFAVVTKHLPLPIELPLEDLEGIMRPLLIIQETLLQLPSMNVPWKSRACEECWTFYMIDDLLLHLAWLQSMIQLQESKYVNIRPLTATEQKQSIPQLDLDACLSLLLANLRGVQISPNVETISLMRALIQFDPTETAMKVRSTTDAQNLVDLIFCLNKNECFESWFGVAAHNATRLAVAIYERVPVLPRSLFLNSADLDRDAYTYQGRAIRTWGSVSSIKRECFDAIIWGSLSHGHVVPLLGICPNMTDTWLISPSPESGTLPEWQQGTNPSVFQIQQIVFEVAKAIQYLHSLDILFRFGCSTGEVFVDSDNHAKVNFCSFLPDYLSDERLDYDGYGCSFTLESNIYSFGLLFYRVLFVQYHGEVAFHIRPKEPEILDNVWQLIKRCCAEDPKARPTMNQVVQEMESWMLLGQFTSSS